MILAVAVAGGAQRRAEADPNSGSDGDESRLFGLVDLSPVAQRAPDPLKMEIERWAAGRGLTKLPDVAMQRALGAPEPAANLVARLVASADARRGTGECAAAVALAREGEATALASLPVDDEREPLKSAYTTLLACEHQLGHAELARAAAVRLRTLVSLPPSALPATLWETYVASAAPTAPAPATPAPAASAPLVELTIDSDPPNARVAVNFHLDGVTPRTLKVAPGLVIVEIEKNGFKKAFRKIAVERSPVRVVFPLVDRRQDRVAQVENAVARLRGNDPMTKPTTLARLAELVRVDVLVAIVVDAGAVKLWWFDADRGDLVGAPVESHFDPATGRLSPPLPNRLSPRPANSPARR